jgi:hypothetical protein
MVVFIVWDDCPVSFGEKCILEAYFYKVQANRAVKELKTQDPYKYQYLAIVRKQLL